MKTSWRTLAAASVLAASCGGGPDPPEGSVSAYPSGSLTVSVAGPEVRIEAREAALHRILGALARHGGFRLTAHGPMSELTTVTLQGPLSVVVANLLTEREYLLKYQGDAGRIIELVVFSQQSGALADPIAVEVDMALTDPDSGVRSDTIVRLPNLTERLGRSYVGRRLGEALRDPDPLVREAGMLALVELGGTEAAGALGDSLALGDTMARQDAVLALGDVGGPAARALLESALSDPDADVSELARDTLGELSRDP